MQQARLLGAAGVQHPLDDSDGAQSVFEGGVPWLKENAKALGDEARLYKAFGGKTAIETDFHPNTTAKEMGCQHVCRRLVEVDGDVVGKHFPGVDLAVSLSQIGNDPCPGAETNRYTGTSEAQCAKDGGHVRWRQGLMALGITNVDVEALCSCLYRGSRVSGKVFGSDRNSWMYRGRTYTV